MCFSMSKTISDNHFPSIVFKLCYELTGKDKEQAHRLYQYVAKCLLSSGSSGDKDEVHVTEKIKRQLSETSGEQETRYFLDLHRKLQEGSILQNRQAVLSFLMHLSDMHRSSRAVLSPPELHCNSIFLPQNVSSRGNLQESLGTMLSNLGTSATNSLTGVNATPLTLSRASTTPMVSRNRTPIGSRGTVTSYESSNPLSNYTDSGLSRVGSSRLLVSPSVNHQTRPAEADLARHVAANCAVLLKSSVPQSMLLQEIVYAVQGIGGKVFKLDPVELDLRVDPEVHLRPPTLRQVMRIVELGWLHNQLRKHCMDCVASRTPGLLERGLVGALRDELTEYYRLVAILQGQVQQQQVQELDSPLSEESPSLGSTGLTLRQMYVWALDPLKRLRLLVKVCTACRGRKGGALASCVFDFLQHGDPYVRKTVTQLLVAVCRPMYVMLSRWMLDGELEDPCGEFFIVASVDVKGDRLWHEKYRVEESLVPSFIPVAQARKILATGKSINFLREVCQDYTPVKGRDMLHHALKCANVEALWSSDRDGDLQAMMDTAYLETSRRVLDVLNGKHKFLENLQALRRYLLLGQGDFIRHLMDIIDPELQKPASQLYPHNLSGILETAIRATNAQFEDADILQRLDVRLLEPTAGEMGWDVFSLDYHVSGPIGTIFAPNAMSYLMLFNALWRAKRMEYILSVTWKRQITSTRLLRRLPELGAILQHTHLLTAEMIHLVQQMQYYTLFEVIECSWHTLIAQVNQAEALDDIISAHNRFLTKVKAGVLLDEDSQELSSQLRSVYDLILQLQTLDEQLHTRGLDELQARSENEERVARRGDMGDYGTTASEEEKNTHRWKNFAEVYLPYVHAQLRVLTKSYQDVVKKFLLLLASHPDVSLQLLSVRLDFNGHYLRSDARLAVPYTYQHRRLSELGAGRACK